MVKRGISIATYNRGFQIGEILEAVLSTKPANCVVNVADDGSIDNTFDVITKDFKGKVNYYGGVNKGVAANKNRCLFAMKDCHFAAIIEDDLKPTGPGWFEQYEKFCLGTGVHHLARIQDKEIPETVPEFTAYCKEKLNLTPIFSSSPRGDLSFFSQKLLRTIGGLNPRFLGVGMGHGEWSSRAAKAGLCAHPLNWLDVRESRDMFVQLSDTTGGRWNDDPEKTKAEIAANKLVRESLKNSDLYVKIELP